MSMNAAGGNDSSIFFIRQSLLNVKIFLNCSRLNKLIPDISK